MPQYPDGKIGDLNLDAGGALRVSPHGAVLQRSKIALPNAGEVHIDLATPARLVIVTVPSGVPEGALQMDLLATATADSPDVDGATVYRIPVPQGTTLVSFYAATNLSAYKASVWTA